MIDFPSREIFEEHYPNVKGTSLGPNDELVVHVAKKVDEEELDVDDIVPTTVVIDGETYLTDVQEVGIPHGQDVSMVSTEPADHRQRHRPIPGGVSIGNENVGAGTMGSPLLETESGDAVVLTNAHVSSGAAEQYQPAEMDGGAEQEPIGTLQEEAPLDPDAVNRTDSALISVDPDQISNEILGLGELAGFDDIEPDFSHTYKKAGRTTGITSGDLKGRDASLRVAYGDKTLRFRGCDVFGPLSGPGDSGSLICVETDDGLIATHLLFAGSDKATIAIPLAEVQDYHGALMLPESDDESGSGGDDEKEWSFTRFRHACRIRPDESVVDGDTLAVSEISLGLDVCLHNERIRLLGIDTAELNSPDPDERERAREQARFVEEWLHEGVEQYDGEDGLPFALDTHKDEHDSFGRLLTHVVRRCDHASLADALLAEFGEDVRYEIHEQLDRLLS